MTNFDYKAHYDEMLELGQQYQDFICGELLKFDKHGVALIIQNIASKEGQFTRGENMLGLEIKFDRRFAETGNLYIEVSARSTPKVEHMTPGGIFSRDESWLYGIGDYSGFWIFGKKQLQGVWNDIGNGNFQQRPGVRAVTAKVNDVVMGRGFILPARVRDELCQRAFTFE